MSARPQHRLITAFRHPLFVSLSLMCCGCGSGDPPSVAGGTEGILRCGSAAIGDLQLTLFQRSGTGAVQVGFAMTRADGTFSLLLPGAAGPLFLPEGQYVCTLESAGAPVRIPKSYSKPDSSPLMVTRKDVKAPLEITGPDLKLR
ncbi:hypothetical protein Pan44_15230 [Caulifigura coniformis]|uniref:Uncharacterized protein n=1 Tax=Caulifigura coniformis TaxID=2527983 RepID=A0A517SBI4_9PLAN|nr:hypothetical protein [Caulifigura coniformis]QDT53501.1 hypothetical protein Pan44_15230 [Caulifigura coniformis]